MDYLPPITIFPLTLVRLTAWRTLLIVVTLLNVACSVGDPGTDPRTDHGTVQGNDQGSDQGTNPAASSGQTSSEPTESSVKKPLSPTPVTGEDLEPVPTLLPEIESSSGLQLGLALPELPIGAPDDESTDFETTEQPVVSRALCTAPKSDMRERLLQLINEARATARFCGDSQFPAAQAVRWNDDLNSAAQRHSTDMATHNFFSHTGSDGSAASTRVTEEGYRWQSVFENIAAGHDTAEETLNDWLDSPGSCRNFMNPAFTDVAVACAYDEVSDFQRYWSNLLAEPR